MQSNTAATIDRKAPQFSIVIPTYRRPESLRNCLSGIAALDYPKSDFEIIIVDDGSEQNPSSVVDQYKWDLSVELICKAENQGPASARNLGARHAKGDYLLFIDDDCIPCRNWLKSFARHLEKRGNQAVGGNCRNGLGDSMCSEAHQMMMDYLNLYHNSDQDQARFCPTNNLAVPREKFLQMGGFDTSFPFAAGEDREFSARWIRSGAGLAFTREAPVYHQHAMGILEFIRMHFRYGCGARRFRQREAENDIKWEFEPFGFYVGLILFPFSQSSVVRAIGLSLLQALSQIAHTCGYLKDFTFKD